MKSGTFAFRKAVCFDLCDDEQSCWVVKLLPGSRRI